MGGSGLVAATDGRDFRMTVAPPSEQPAFFSWLTTVANMLGGIAR